MREGLMGPSLRQAQAGCERIGWDRPRTYPRSVPRFASQGSIRGTCANELLSRKAEPVFYTFDLLWLNGEDLRNQPLTTRKKRLARLIRSADCPRILYAQHIEQYGKGFFEEICSRDLEGIVAERRLSIYKDDGQGWLKIKNRTYSQAEGRHELLTRKPKP